MLRPLRILVLAVVGTAVTAPIAEAERITTQGRWLVDDAGRVVVLHGVNHIPKRPPYDPATLGFERGARPDAARALAAEGFNVVRLGLILTAFSPRPGRWQDAYPERVRGTMRRLWRHGIYSQLDLHQDRYHERWAGQGFPGWMIVDDGVGDGDADPEQAYFLSPSQNRVWDNFWADRRTRSGARLQAVVAEMWRRVARRLGDEPGLAGYDILNEPWAGRRWPTCNGPTGCPDFDRRVLTPFFRRVARAIRSSDPRGAVYYEPHATTSFGRPTYIGDIGDPHAAFSFHHYCPVGLRETLRRRDLPVCRRAGDSVFANARRVARRNGDALLLSEFGATDKTFEIERVAEQADARMVGWVYWTWFSREPTLDYGPAGILVDPDRAPTPGNLKQAKLDVLARPYPRAVAGVPEGWRWERREGRFGLRYRTRSARGRRLPRHVLTEIALPRRHFRRGYVARVRGGAVVSRPGALLLRVRRAADAPVVDVRVRRR